MPGLSAQEAKQPEGENYVRRIKALENESLELAMTYFIQELWEHPDNGYALAHMAAIQSKGSECGAALATVNVAMQHIPLEVRNL